MPRLKMGNLQHRGKGSFTHVENTVFFDHELSLKAKGIYCHTTRTEVEIESSSSDSVTSAAGGSGSSGKF